MDGRTNFAFVAVSWVLEDKLWMIFTSTCLRMIDCQWLDGRSNGDTLRRPHQIRCVSWLAEIEHCRLPH